MNRLKKLPSDNHTHTHQHIKIKQNKRQLLNLPGVQFSDPWRMKKQTGKHGAFQLWGEGLGRCKLQDAVALRTPLCDAGNSCWYSWRSFGCWDATLRKRSPSLSTPAVSSLAFAAKRSPHNSLLPDLHGSFILSHPLLLLSRLCLGPWGLS